MIFINSDTPSGFEINNVDYSIIIRPLRGRKFLTQLHCVKADNQ